MPRPVDPHIAEAPGPLGEPGRLPAGLANSFISTAPPAWKRSVSWAFLPVSASVRSAVSVYGRPRRHRAPTTRPHESDRRGDLARVAAGEPPHPHEELAGDGGVIISDGAGAERAPLAKLFLAQYGRRQFLTYQVGF